MELTWIGQAGFLIRTGENAAVLIDPYLSDSLRENRRDERFRREIPVDPRYLATPDILVITHLHEDHADFGTLDILFKGKKMYVIAPGQVIEALKERYGTLAEYISFAPGAEVTLKGMRFRAMPAEHSTKEAIGVSISGDGKTVWHTGDTLYHRSLPAEKLSPDLLILPINGVGNNMNAAEAARLTGEVRPAAVLPMHWDMFKAFGTDPSEFCRLMENADIPVIMPEVYRPFSL